MKNNLILALLSSAFLLGCAAKYQSISPDVGVALTIENKGAAVMANIHTDNQCTKLPNGDWLG